MLLKFGLVGVVLMMAGAVRLCLVEDACCAGTGCAVTAAATTQPTTQPAAFVCPMHPDVTSDKPAKCSKCGMDLVAKKVEKPAHDHEH